jgi:hypothetical protein
MLLLALRDVPIALQTQEQADGTQRTIRMRVSQAAQLRGTLQEPHAPAGTQRRAMGTGRAATPGPARAGQILRSRASVWRGLTLRQRAQTRRSRMGQTRAGSTRRRR